MASGLVSSACVLGSGSAPICVGQRTPRKSARVSYSYAASPRGDRCTPRASLTKEQIATVSTDVNQLELRATLKGTLETQPKLHPIHYEYEALNVESDFPNGGSQKRHAGALYPGSETYKSAHPCTHRYRTRAAGVCRHGQLRSGVQGRERRDQEWTCGCIVARRGWDSFRRQDPSHVQGK
jgi:hypothetical protein